MHVYRWIFVVALVAGVVALFVLFSNGQRSPGPELVSSGQTERGPAETATPSDRPANLDENPAENLKI